MFIYELHNLMSLETSYIPPLLPVFNRRESMSSDNPENPKHLGTLLQTLHFTSEGGIRGSNP